jgi:hypothetical protein
MSRFDEDTARRLRGALALLLQSDSDGERLAAVNAILTLLAKAGMGVADLVPEPVGASPPEPMHADPKAWRRAMYPEHGGAPGRAALTAEHQRLALTLLHSATPWSDKDRSFLESMARQRGKPSSPQADWLRDLQSKARRCRAERERATA